MSGPTAHRVALPTDGRLPVVGKIRLGTMQETQKNGRAVTFPKAADHFVVTPDDSTPDAAAESFHTVYGAEPKAVRCVLPAATTDDVLQGSYRLYGTGAKLKRICSGETCDEKSTTGAWVTKPCVCQALDLAEGHKDRCTLTYTLQVLLPDVVGVGVWQVDTGSEISARNLTSWLQLTEQLRGSLLWVPFTLRLKAIHGRQGVVYVLDPEVLLDETPREAITAAEERRSLAAGTGAPQLPPPLADETVEPTLDADRLRQKDSQPGAPSGDETGPHSAPGTPGAPSEKSDPAGTPLRQAVKEQLEQSFLSPLEIDALKRHCKRLDVAPSSGALSDHFGEEARNLHALIARLEEEHPRVPAGGEQETLT